MNYKNDLWNRLKKEASEAASTEPELATLMHKSILDHMSLEIASAHLIARKLASPLIQEAQFIEICTHAFSKAPDILEAWAKDLHVIPERDAACISMLQPFLMFKSAAALLVYRIGHFYWNAGKKVTALLLQNNASEALQLDIHPAARIGQRCFIDHGTGVVIGETSVIGDDVTIMHQVTLGGNGKEHTDRHPKISNHVLISTGASILGNVKIGEGARIAASSVVLQEVPAHVTVAGIPAKIVKCKPIAQNPADCINHDFSI